MKARKKVAIYIDYTIRVPNIIKTYVDFKESIFSNAKFEDTEDPLTENDPRFYWYTQMQNPAIEKFYFEVRIPDDEDLFKTLDWSTLFYNDDHYKKFIDEYSYNLYLDCPVPNAGDIDIVNIAQTQLFDVVLVDEYKSKRKIGNTFHFLSTKRVYPQSVIFLGEGQNLNEENYIGIWNPRKKPEQVNKPKDKSFLNWFMELEKKVNGEP